LDKDSILLTINLSYQLANQKSTLMKIIYPKLLLLLVVFSFSCQSPEEKPIAETVFSNGTIYTVANSGTVEAVAVKDGLIVYAGSTTGLANYIGEGTLEVDLKGKTMTPGFIESHGHLMGLGQNELNLDLMGIKNYDEMVEMVREAVAKSEPGDWILGRGWHQSKWDKTPEKVVKGFQTHDKLSEVSPDNPVFLRHASGHAAFANAKAMEIAGVNQMSIESLTQDLEGGEVIRDANGNPTGIFSERATGLIARHVPDQDEERSELALELAIKACQRNGITSFHDAGVGQQTIDRYLKFKDEGKLGLRVYAMVSGPNRDLTHKWLDQGPMIDTTDHLLTVRSIKLNADGALGNRGAWLIEEYSDMPGEYGMATLPMDYVLEISNAGLERGFQVCSHAIGDRTNREIFDNYEEAFRAHPEVKDHRFRIEHAQHLHPDDLPRFAQLNVIAAMQAVHMSSDRPWAIDRLGEKRIVEGAYMWQTILESGAKVINGTDVPVEPINPLASFYASVTRKTLKGEPEDGYEPAEKMTRNQALRSYTLDAAYGEFEEDFKGSIEEGKAADFTVFTKDIMTIPEEEILTTEIVMTILDGKIVYDNSTQE